MERAGKVKWSEIKVGIVIFIGLVFAVYASFRGAGTSIFEKKTKYVSYFCELEGMVIGAPVWLAGVEVGNVYSIKFLKIPVEADKNIVVKFKIKSSVQYLVTPGTSVQISTIGLLGDKYLKLIPGPPSETSLADGSIIPAEGIAGLDGALKEAPEIAARFKRILGSIDNLLAVADTGSGTVSRLMHDREMAERISGLIDKSSALVNTLDRSASTMLRDVNAIRQDFHALTEELLDGSGTLARLFKDPSLFDNMMSATARLDTILSKIDSGEGTMGQLIADQEMYNEMADLVARMNTFVNDLMENPKKYLKLSIF